MLELGALKTEPVDAASYNKRVELIWDGLSHHEGEQYKTEYSFTCESFKGIVSHRRTVAVGQIASSLSLFLNFGNLFWI